MPDNKTEVIEIKSIDPKEYPSNIDYVVKDQDSRIFHVYKFKKNTQTESTAYQQMVNMGLRSDLAKDIKVVVEIWYAEVPNAKGGTSRYIASFRETMDQPTQTSVRTGTSPGEHSVASQGGSTDAFGRRLGVQGHINALLSNPNYYAGGEDIVSIAEIVKEAIAIEDEAEKQLNPSRLRQAVQRHAPAVVEELPTIQVEEVDVEDIPF
jgi:hypothetical protein